MPDARSLDQVGGELWKRLAAHFFEEDSPSLDYDEFCAIGIELGLLDLVPYDPAGGVVVPDAEPGEEVYLPTALGRRLFYVAEITAN